MTNNSAVRSGPRDADPLLIGLDIGTSAVRATAFTLRGAPVASGMAPLAVSRPTAGRVEQDARSWSSQAEAALACMAAELGPAVSRVRAVGLTGQCPSFTLLSARGAPLVPGILYADNRATVEAARLVTILGRQVVRDVTGQWPGAFYVAPKVMWLVRSGVVPAGRDAHSREATLVQPRDLVGLHLTGNLATDTTHAACTLLFDTWQGIWCREWASYLDLEWLRLPPVLQPWEVVGRLRPTLSAATGLPDGAPVVIGGADSLSAALGVGATVPGILSDASGSSTCLDLPLEESDCPPGASLYPHVVPDVWCADTGMNATGAVLKWAADLLTGGDVAALEALAATGPPGCDGLFFWPTLGDGERTDGASTGGWARLSLRHGRAHLARSVYEGLTFGLREALGALHGPGQLPMTVVQVSGGSGQSRLWSQLKADIFGLPVVSSRREAAALGAAMLAGIATRTYTSFAEAASLCSLKENCYEPNLAQARLYEAAYAAWQRERICGTPPRTRGAV